MPYTVRDAPPRRVLPKAALKLWVSTFNSVFDETGDEDQARQAAWANVKDAGYRKGEDGQWHKARAESEIEDQATVVLESPGFIERAEALALPTPTPSKVYAEFKLLSFDKPNANKDGFRKDWVTDDIVETLVSSPIYVAEDASDHPERNARSTDRAKYQVGSVAKSELRDDGIYCVGAFQREFLEDRDISPAEIPQHYAVSMEVMFDRSKARYTVGDKTLDYHSALETGVAAPIGAPDDRSKYDARWIPPKEFYAVAMLKRGRNADREADFLRVAASEGADMAFDEIIWAPDDQEAYLAYFALNPDEQKAMGAELTTEKRKALPRGAFAYVDEDGKGHLPIHDAAHVRNALARLNQTDIPEAAKKKALRKILAAAKRMGVEVSKDSPAVKAYGDMHGSMEDMMSHIREAFYKQFGNADPAYVVETYADYVIARKGEDVMRVPFSMAGEEVKFGDPVKGKMVFQVEGEKEGADAKPAAQPAPAVDEKALRARVELELRPKIEAEYAAKFEKEKAKVAEQAVEAHKAREKQIGERLSDLAKVQPITDDEREDLEQKVRAADDLAFANIKNERLLAALEKARTDKGHASKDPVPPTLRPGASKTEVPNPYRVTVN